MRYLFSLYHYFILIHIKIKYSALEKPYIEVPILIFRRLEEHCADIRIDLHVNLWGNLQYLIILQLNYKFRKKYRYSTLTKAQKFLPRHFASLIRRKISNDFFIILLWDFDGRTRRSENNCSIVLYK